MDKKTVASMDSKRLVVSLVFSLVVSMDIWRDEEKAVVSVQLMDWLD